MIAAHWEDYWASGGTSDRALGGASQRAFLTQHWAVVFANHANSASTIVDIACGDGAVFAFGRAQLAADATLIAIDAAPAAARAAMSVDGVIGAAADAGRLPLADGAADIVVSQFGLEYGGDRAFSEAARILRAGGVLEAVSHLKGGGIDVQCRENARVLQAFASERLGEYALATLAETQTSGPSLVLSYDAHSELRFRAAMQRVAAIIRAAPESTARGMVASAIRELAAVAARRRAFDSAEVSAFVSHIVTSLTAYHDRMRAMLAASLDSDGMSRIAERLRAAGMIEVDAAPVAFARGAAPGAWRIRARRAD